MSLALPDVLLFDLDGTLVDTYRLYLESYRRALAPELGYTPSHEEIATRRPISERGFLRDWLGDEQRADACHAEFRAHYRALHGGLAEGVYPGVREMLAALRAVGYRLGLVTGKGREAWELTEAVYGLGPWEVVITDGDVSAPKPHPEGILTALDRLGADPRAAAYFGDGAGDLRAGRSAGVRVGAVLWPKTAAGESDAFLSEIAPLEPDWVFAGPGDLTATFASWC